MALSIASGLAHATTVLIPTGVDWNRGEAVWIDKDGTPQDAYFAGVILLSVQQNGNYYSRDSMCVDLFTDIYLNEQYTSQLLRPDQVAGKNLTRVSWLVDNALLPTQGAYPSELPPADWVTSAAQGAGLQLAIWDITTDGGDGFSAGKVQASTVAGETTDAAVLAWAVTYEALSAGKSSDRAFVYDNVSLSAGAPAQMLEGPMFADNGPTPAPEPATFLVVGVTLIAIGLGGRRLSAYKKGSASQ